MPDVVRLRNQHGHPVEVNMLGPTVADGDVIDVPGRLVTDMAEYRQLMDLPPDAELGPDVSGYHFIFGPAFGPAGVDGDRLAGWPKVNWELVTDTPSTVDSKRKGDA